MVVVVGASVVVDVVVVDVVDVVVVVAVVGTAVEVVSATTVVEAGDVAPLAASPVQADAMSPSEANAAAMVMAPVTRADKVTQLPYRPISSGWCQARLLTLPGPLMRDTRNSASVRCARRMNRQAPTSPSFMEGSCQPLN